MQSVVEISNWLFTLLHQVTNYHVVAKLAGDGSESHRCKVLPFNFTIYSLNIMLLPFVAFLVELVSMHIF
jgi:hypothetical protein